MVVGSGIGHMSYRARTDMTEGTAFASDFFRSVHAADPALTRCVLPLTGHPIAAAIAAAVATAPTEEKERGIKC
jgi:hypothetical protein